MRIPTLKRGGIRENDVRQCGLLAVADIDGDVERDQGLIEQDFPSLFGLREPIRGTERVGHVDPHRLPALADIRVDHLPHSHVVPVP